MTFFSVSNIHMYIAVGLSIVNAILMWFVAYKFFQILQLSNYRTKEYFTWIKDTKGRYISRLFMLTILSLALMSVTNVILDTQNVNEFWSYLGLIFYFYLTGVFIYNLYNAPKKTPLKITNRMNRLKYVFFLVCAVITFLLIWLFTVVFDPIRYAVIALTPIMLPIIVPIVNLIMAPIEKLISRRYIVLAKKKLKKYPNLIKIGITGSFGKTSTKFFLQTILSEKYSVLASPFSYNTPMGITKSIIQYLDFSHQILIAEMGARFVGDIKELCELVSPQYGIITSVGEQHLQTFKTLDNIKNTKYELVEGLAKGGLIVFNGENEICQELYDKTNIDKMITGFNDKFDVFASNMVTDKSGTKFTLHIQGQSIDCSTKLLGEHNIEDILTAVALAHRLGLSLQEIANGISRLQPIEHRLQLISSSDNITILDDSYNGSIEGSKKALDILKMFEGEKIIVTPGLVELGVKEKQANIEFGERIAQVADKVIIVNVTHSLDIKQGLLNKNFDEKNIYQIDTLNSISSIIRKMQLKNCTILFYNDLPDNYL